MLVLFLAVLMSLSVSFFCSLMEACLLSLSNTNIAEIAQKTPKTANIWRQLKSNIQKPIAVILIINTLAHTIGAAISGAQFSGLFGTKWIITFSLAFSLIMIQYTEILPKTLGVRYNKMLAKISAIPLLFMVRIFRPIITLIEFANRPFEGKGHKEKDTIAKEITILASSAVLENKLSLEQASLISKSIQMSTSKVSDIMVDKNDTIFLSDSMSLMEAFLASHIHRHTRFPLIVRNDYNKVLGYVNFKDIVTALHVAPTDPNLKGICRPIPFISETMSLNILLKKMIREHQHIAIVQDLNGYTIGMVTLEDIIESLVGDIEDEFYRPPAMMVILSENRWRVGGGVILNQLRDKAFKELPEWDLTVDEIVKANLHGMELKENFEFALQGIKIKVHRIARDYVYDVIAEKPKNDPEKKS